MEYNDYYGAGSEMDDQWIYYEAFEKLQNLNHV